MKSLTFVKGSLTQGTGSKWFSFYIIFYVASNTYWLWKKVNLSDPRFRDPEKYHMNETVVDWSYILDWKIVLIGKKYHNDWKRDLRSRGDYEQISSLDSSYCEKAYIIVLCVPRMNPIRFRNSILVMSILQVSRRQTSTCVCKWNVEYANKLARDLLVFQ